MGAPPGMFQTQTPQSGGFPSTFQPPAGLNFNAPRTGMGGQDARAGGGGGYQRDRNAGGDRRGQGLGFDNRRDDGGGRMRDNVVLIPSTREEVMRTIFVGNITEALTDNDMQRILGCAGGFRKWTRAIDTDNRPCKFGFAEFEDADSLAVATEIYQEVVVPVKRPTAQEEARKEEKRLAKQQKVKKEEYSVEVKLERDEEDVKMEADDVKMENGDADVKEEDFKNEVEDEDEEPEMKTLNVVVDENSRKYIEEWRGRGSLRDPAEAQFRIDQAKEELQSVLASLRRAPQAEEDMNGDSIMGNGVFNFDGMPSIPGANTAAGTTEDELSEIPVEMRESVLKEIAAFRDRSNKRDLRRLELEEEESRKWNAPTHNRANSPTIPSGPRGAPLGPRGYTGAQLPSDYRNGVNFTNSEHIDEDEDTSASDSELEARRTRRQREKLDEFFPGKEEALLRREKHRAGALEREAHRNATEADRIAKLKTAMAARLKDWDDEAEAAKGTEEYYTNRSAWVKHRAAFKAREAEQDAKDRQIEAREQARANDARNREINAADQFLAETAAELDQRQRRRGDSRAPEQPTRFKMSLGAALTQKTAASNNTSAPAPRRSALADAEDLLDDSSSDPNSTNKKRTLIPLSNLPPIGASMTAEERDEARRTLASEIPTSTSELFAFPVPWDHVTEDVLEEHVRPFVEKKVVEYLGVQEDMLVEVVEAGLRARKRPQELVEELGGALESEEAVGLVRKVWRLVVFCGESERRGFN